MSLFIAARVVAVEEARMVRVWGGGMGGLVRRVLSRGEGVKWVREDGNWNCTYGDLGFEGGVFRGEFDGRGGCLLVLLTGEVEILRQALVLFLQRFSLLRHDSRFLSQAAELGNTRIR